MAFHTSDMLRSGATAFSATETNTASLKINGTSRFGYIAVAQWSGVTGGTNDISTLHATSSPTGGTYTLTLGGVTTTTLQYNDSVTTILNAIRALKGCVINNVTYDSALGASAVTSTTTAATGFAAGDVAIDFGGPLAAQPITLTINSGSLTGGSGYTVTHTTTGVGPTCHITFQTGDDNSTWATPNQFGSIYCGPGLYQSRPVILEATKKYLSYTATFGGSGTFKNLQIAVAPYIEGYA